MARMSKTWEWRCPPSRFEPAEGREDAKEADEKEGKWGQWE